jgi:hypothetical protein
MLVEPLEFNLGSLGEALAVDALVGHVRYVMKMTERFSGFLFATF